MDKKIPKISIVTPSYNSSKYIEECIQSVLNQNYPNFEHIIIDGSSTDGTVEILKKYPHLKWVSEPDKGQSDALNKGFKMATGDIIGWLNADDYYLSGCFKSVSEEFQKNENIDVLYGDFRFVNERGEVLQNRKELNFDLFTLKYLHVLYIPTTASFFSKRIFVENNYLNINYNYAMDYEFFLRIALKGYIFHHINYFLADFRWHNQSKSSIYTKKQRTEQLQALYGLDPFLKKLPKLIKKITRKTLEIIARNKRYLNKFIKGYYFNQWQYNFRFIIKKLRSTIFRIKFELQNFLNIYPNIYFTILRLRKKHLHLVVTNETDIIIEGFPRSANTFAVEAFLLAQSYPIKIAHHLHASAQIIKGVELNIPTLILIRNPRDAVLSLMVREPFITANMALKMYCKFYEKILPLKPHIVIAKFEDVISDFGNIISLVNKKYGTHFHNFIHIKENVEKVFKKIEYDDKIDENKNSVDIATVARPIASRKKLKIAKSKELNKASKNLMLQAEYIYKQFIT